MLVGFIIDACGRYTFSADAYMVSSGTADHRDSVLAVCDFLFSNVLWRRGWS